MTMPRSCRAFSLIELIMVIVVIAIIASVVMWHVIGVAEASRRTADKQNISTWNTAYTNVVASGYKLTDGTEFSTLDWTNASSQLAAGVEVQLSSGPAMNICAAVPVFHNSSIPSEFVPGKGIVEPAQ
jgi:prepilin-type N-terminal cleavage/methylation domain-containing protein